MKTCRFLGSPLCLSTSDVPSYSVSKPLVIGLAVADSAAGGGNTSVVNSFKNTTLNTKNSIHNSLTPILNCRNYSALRKFAESRDPCLAPLSR